jgi:hypothetical protein
LNDRTIQFVDHRGGRLSRLRPLAEEKLDERESRNRLVGQASCFADSLRAWMRFSGFPRRGGEKHAKWH